MSSYVHAQRDQSVTVGSTGYFVREGEVWDANDPLVKAWPDLFDVHPPVVHNTQGRSRDDYANAEFSAEPRRRGGRA